MSAIFGQFHFDGCPAIPAELLRMEQALRALGPDRCGTRLRAHAGLGQCLSSVTPEDAWEEQPVDSDECLLVTDARLDNRPELAESLGIAASEAASSPDSQFILRAYRKWGVAAARHMVGAFAFALYDIRENLLLLARSARGERTLFYHATPKAFYFASAPRGLFALPSIPRRLNLERVADSLLVMPPGSGSTFYSGIQSVPPGCQLVVRKSGVETTEFWRVEPHKHLRFSRDSDYIDAFAELFSRVVTDCLRTAGPVGILMSGGLDSASIGAVAARKLAMRQASLSAFTEVPQVESNSHLPGGRYSDETPYVTQIAAMHRNIDLHFVRTDGRFFLDGVERFFEAAEAPFRNASNRVWWEAALERASSEGIRTVLTGINGNLTISWDGKNLLPELLRNARWIRAAAEIRAAGWPMHAASWRPVASDLLQLLPLRSRWVIQKLRRGPASAPPWTGYSPIREEFAKEQRVRERANASGHLFHMVRMASGRAVTLSRSHLGSDIERGHREMFGTETRHPADDQRIVDFCLALPEEQFRRLGTSRWLIKRAMAGQLPPEVLNLRMRGLQAADWASRLLAHRAELNHELDLMTSSPLASHVIDTPRVRLAFARLAANRESGTDLGLRSFLERAFMTGRFLRWAESKERTS